MHRRFTGASEKVEQLLGHLGTDCRANSSTLCGLIQNTELIGLRQGFLDCLHVKRLQATKLNQINIESSSLIASMEESAFLDTVQVGQHSHGVACLHSSSRGFVKDSGLVERHALAQIYLSF
jgi:hypothetical protein